MIKNLLFIDTETTGLDPKEHEMIEFAALMYSVKHRTALWQVSTLLPVRNNQNSAKHINGIDEFASRGARAWMEVLSVAQYALKYGQVDAIAAHNADFDYVFTRGYELGDENTPWIDTRDIIWPKAPRIGCNLVDLALAYDVPVWGNHRALVDCQLLANVAQREPEFSQLLEEANTTCQWYIVNCTRDDKDIHALCKQHGFRWNDEKCPQPWKWSKKCVASHERLWPEELRGRVEVVEEALV